MFRLSKQVIRPNPLKFRPFTVGTSPNLTAHSPPLSINQEDLDVWIAQPKHFELSDTLHPERLSDLYITLPTRDGSRKPFHEPKRSHPLPPGFEIAYFHFRTPESELRPDGTDGEFCPPNPFSRRMWASGKMTWDPNNPLLIGERATATWTVDSVQKKGFDKGKPMLFVNKKIDFTMAGKSTPSLVEERVHVYLPDAQAQNRIPREVKDLPTSSDFSFTYVPSLTTLFRFSAIMWNAHHIHLDKDYAVEHEGYPERLVHGPLTSLMLLEAVADHSPKSTIRVFEYRARNPLVVGRSNTIHGKYLTKENSIQLWCVDEEGVVGMTGKVELV
ncbi:hypothetical protein GYMLUDRAFT_45978 [Collybiopsis luxurians FD-317 M1]|uniref:Mesaconyl-C4 CoA hydratase n=1 Tax=Collybiopsis luxurians FD-317 M1 TaxID=944289 RepID=A0A0D0CHP3_9AGAR|nr:hypothetical protein GYMLUDRAFT_45978 [Collybiopsis luxurians FD-317 M1]